MARSPEEGTEFNATLGDIAGMTSEQVEQKLATKAGLDIPLAGLPDEDAIEEVFGLTRNQISADKTRRS